MSYVQKTESHHGNYLNARNWNHNLSFVAVVWQVFGERGIMGRNDGALSSKNTSVMNNNNSFVRFWNDYQIHIFHKPRIVIDWRAIEDNVVGRIIDNICPLAVAAGMVSIGEGFGWLPHEDDLLLLGAVFQVREEGQQEGQRDNEEEKEWEREVHDEEEDAEKQAEQQRQDEYLEVRDEIERDEFVAGTLR